MTSTFRVPARSSQQFSRYFLSVHETARLFSHAAMTKTGFSRGVCYRRKLEKHTCGSPTCASLRRRFQKSCPVRPKCGWSRPRPGCYARTAPEFTGPMRVSLNFFVLNQGLSSVLHKTIDFICEPLNAGSQSSRVDSSKASSIVNHESKGLEGPAINQFQSQPKDFALRHGLQRMSVWCTSRKLEAIQRYCSLRRPHLQLPCLLKIEALRDDQRRRCSATGNVLLPEPMDPSGLYFLIGSFSDVSITASLTQAIAQAKRHVRP